MKKYAFYDSHDNPDYQEYELKGEAYKELLKVCFQYSDILSFLQWDIIQSADEFSDVLKQDVIIERLEEFRILEKDSLCIKDTYLHDETICCSHPMLKQDILIKQTMKYYKVSPGLLHVLLNATDDIFWWMNRYPICIPENPCFYRKDGSVFFESVIHEGELYLYLKEGEDASRLFELSKWWTGEDIRRYS